MKTGKTRNVQTNKTNYMSDEAFADLKDAMEDVLAFERGKHGDLKITRIQAPRPPKAMSPSLETSREYAKGSTARKRSLQ